MGGIDRSLIAAAPISDAGGQVPGDDAAIQVSDDDLYIMQMKRLYVCNEKSTSAQRAL